MNENEPTVADPTPERLAALAWTIHRVSGCSGCPPDREDVAAANAVFASTVLADLLAAARAEALREARDALYRGEGPDLSQDSDIVYGVWLSNRATRIKADR